MQYSVPFRTVVSMAHGRVANWTDRELWKEAVQWYQGLVKGHYGPGQAYFGDPDAWPERGPEEPVIGHEVWVAAPERSRTEQFDERTGRRLAVRIINEEGVTFWSTWNDQLIRHTQLWPTDPERRRIDRMFNPRHEDSAAALLLPRWFFTGLDPVWGSRVERTFLGRAAYELTLTRMVDPADPLIIATDDMLRVLHDAQTVEVVIDVERNVVLEWRGLFEGQVYERHFFTELTFDEPLDEVLFDIHSGPRPAVTVPDERPARPPEAVLIEGEGGARQVGLVEGVVWLIDGVVVHEPAEGPLPEIEPLVLASDRVMIAMATSSLPRGAMAAFVVPGSDVPAAMVPCIPVGMIYAGGRRPGTIDRSADGESIQLVFAPPAEKGTWRLLVHVHWMPPPFNSAEPPHPDVPVYRATWVFAVRVGGE